MFVAASPSIDIIACTGERRVFGHLFGRITGIYILPAGFSPKDGAVMAGNRKLVPLPC